MEGGAVAPEVEGTRWIAPLTFSRVEENLWRGLLFRAPLAVRGLAPSSVFSISDSAAESNDVAVDGNFFVNGSKDFRIDHPLDPTNKYLYHASIESSEVLNQYSGNVVLDDKGEGQVEFPEWFAAINEDFRYQLTAIGAPGPNLYIAKEISGNDGFTIGGGQPGLKVSWQVTAAATTLT